MVKVEQGTLGLHCGEAGPGGGEVWASAGASPDYDLPPHAEAPSCNLTSLMQSPQGP